MFTGIIEEMGKLINIDRQGQAMRLTIQGKKVLEGISLGDSIAVNGVCLTAVTFDASSFSVDVMPETYRHTNLKQLQSGSIVNLERAMQAGGRFGGHIVQGHVETIGTIKSRKREENAVVFTIEPQNRTIMKYIIPKGSITLDGISLTVVHANDHSFSVSIIPHTLKETVLQYKEPGSTINIETDILGKYIEHLLRFRQDDENHPLSSQEDRITKQFLNDNGFL